VYRLPQAGEFIENLQRLASQPMTGKTAMAYRSSLNNAFRDAAATPGQGTYAEALRDTLEAFDAWVGRVAPEDVAEKWATARDQWRMLASLESGRVVDPRGDVNLMSAWSELRRAYPAEFLRGDQFGTTTAPVADFMDAVRIGAAFSDVVGNSGTATRQAAGDVMTAPLTTMAWRAATKKVGKAVTQLPTGAFGRGVAAWEARVPGALERLIRAQSIGALSGGTE
jgi:hypothetical protein